MLDVASDFGLIGDGAADNYAAFRAMAAAARYLSSAWLSWPRGEFKVVLPRGVQTLYEMAPNVTWVGVPGASTIAVYAEADEPKLPFRCTRQGTAHAAFQGISFARRSPWSGALVSLACGSDLRFRLCAFDGGGGDRTIGPASGAVSGVMYAQDSTGAVLSNVTFDECDWTGCDVGLGSPNQGFATVRGLTLRGCHFGANLGHDVAFNGPDQTTLQETSNTVPADRPFLQQRLRVLDCDFRDNAAGIAIGLAHVRGAMVRGCTFADYARQAIQVEDHAHGVSIVGNHFARCATAGGGLGVVMLIEAAHGISVNDNTFDQSTATDPAAACVYAGPGCLPGQYSQLPDPAPYNLLIACNHGRTGKGAGVVAAGARGVSECGNSFVA